jgi:hypothetical protein
MNAPIPIPDVLPVPAPVGLLLFLLVFTFIAHVVPMNFLLGGGILTAISHILSGKSPHHARLAKRISELMPTVVAFTVTLGIAPLLFVQVLYGHLLYSSSILMANAWFMVIPLVILGYYGVYLIRFRWERLGSHRTWVAWVVAVLFAVVGFIYTNNFTLLQRPETWLSHYLESPTTGHLNWSDSSVYPRYLHMLLGALAVAGLWFMIIGVRRKSGDLEWSNWLWRYGVRIFTHATVLNVFIGFWFMLAVPRNVLMIFMGENRIATGAFVASLACLVAAFAFIHGASRRQSRRGAFVGAGWVLAVVALMAVMRQEMRTAYLEPYFRLSELQAEPQWGVFGVFVVTLVVGLGVLAWLISALLRARSSAAPSADS